MAFGNNVLELKDIDYGKDHAASNSTTKNSKSCRKKKVGSNRRFVFNETLTFLIDCGRSPCIGNQTYASGWHILCYLPTEVRLVETS